MLKVKVTKKETLNRVDVAPKVISPETKWHAHKRGLIDGASARCGAYFTEGHEFYGCQEIYDAAYKIGNNWYQVQIHLAKVKFGFTLTEADNAAVEGLIT